ncbi:MAG: glycosyltransferase family A protein, partial [Paludibacteraceae bacterium]|nr:glycosyltransferase family A protein [Paludibacteraceae bacterium]
MDLVSIIMPAYNSGRFIEQSIRSVLSQTYTEWELLIVDDCSTDDTPSIVASFKDKRIHFQRNEHNMGAALSRNKAIQAAKGKYIAFLDADDKWLPTKLEKQVGFMQNN